MNLLKGMLCLCLFIIAVARISITGSHPLIQKRHAEIIISIAESLVVITGLVTIECATKSLEDQERTISNLKRTIRHRVQSKKKWKEGPAHDS